MSTFRRFTRPARRLSALVITVAACAISLLSFAPAEAATARVSLSPSSAPPGGALALRGSGFAPSTIATFTWDSSTPLGQTRVSASGALSATTHVPTDASGGQHALTVRDNGLAVTLTVTVQGGAATSTPTPTPTQAPPPTSAPEARVLDLVNQARASAGAGPLTVNSALVSAARSYSGLMASTNCFAHTCGPVPDFSQRDTNAGYTGWTTLGENIAAGYATADDVFSGWMNSPGHKANILNASFRETGIGLATGGTYGTYWTEEFGAR